MKSVILVRLYMPGILLYASCSLFFADFHAVPSVIHMNSKPLIKLIFEAISVNERATSLSLEPPPL